MRISQRPARRTSLACGELWVEIAVDGRPIQIVDSHLGLPARERQGQAKALLGPGRAGSRACTPSFVLRGDFNAVPRASPMRGASPEGFPARPAFRAAGRCAASTTSSSPRHGGDADGRSADEERPPRLRPPAFAGGIGHYRLIGTEPRACPTQRDQPAHRYLIRRSHRSKTGPVSSRRTTRDDTSRSLFLDRKPRGRICASTEIRPCPAEVA
ncbi:hypothetical protein AIGOOFII_1714 [Methylobacterium marchantiae]|nr:hypothetical protein AIGOOFII_1714 [Methylobacterium marchantiae]